MIRLQKILLVVFVSAFVSSVVFAHEDLVQRIEKLTKEIKSEPKNAQLYLRRGELYYFHEEWTNAENDFNAAEKLDSSLLLIDFMRGRMYLDSKRPELAEQSLNRFLQKNPKHFGALRTRGRVYDQLKKYEKAVSDYNFAIENAPEPSLEMFLERADAIIAGSQPSSLETALQSLDSGIGCIGNVPALYDAAIAIELKLKKFDAAIARLNKIMEKLPRKEQILLRRGEIELEAGKFCDARASFEQTLEAVKQNANERRNPILIKEIKTKANNYLIENTIGKCEIKN